MDFLCQLWPLWYEYKYNDILYGFYHYLKLGPQTTSNTKMCHQDITTMFRSVVTFAIYDWLKLTWYWLRQTERINFTNTSTPLSTFDNNSPRFEKEKCTSCPKSMSDLQEEQIREAAVTLEVNWGKTYWEYSCKYSMNSSLK